MDVASQDTLLGERILWSGRPTSIETPTGPKVVAFLSFAISAVSLCFATVISLSLRITPTQPLLLAAWAAIFGVLVLQAPKIWLERVQYVVTERQVVVQRGLYRRTIERSAISFALIRWSKRASGVGDIRLVRAVPTGALRRRLLLEIRGVAAPDRVFAIIRGAQSSVEPHKGDRPLTQRLDDGETVVWSARPLPSLGAYLPRGPRQLGILALSAILLFAAFAMLSRALPNLRLLERAGLPEIPFIALLLGEGISLLLVVGTAAHFVRRAIFSSWKSLRSTRYLITNRRVLMQRGREELHLDREKIVDVIPMRSRRGLTDVFLVLDGPRARAVATGGAFGEIEMGPELSPVLMSVQDVESVSRILLERSATESREAA